MNSFSRIDKTNETTTMYSIYRRYSKDKTTFLEFVDRISLAGCNNGIIPKVLREKITKNDNPPIGWTLHLAKEYNQHGKSIIIDIKPKSNEVFLCELDTVFGFSYSEWSPVMYRLKRLYSNVNPQEFDKRNFIYPDNPQILYTVLYLSGSFSNGELNGSWNPPFGTITALLYWPEAMTFFHRSVQEYDPDYLAKKNRYIG